MLLSLEQRFWKKVDKTPGLGVGDCWLWTGSRKRQYGEIWISKEDGKTVAHRISFMLSFGPIGDGLVVRHKCDVPLCVNPAHLETGTHQENVIDRQVRKRGVDKLSAEIVQTARVRHSLGEPAYVIAADYGVNRRTMEKAIKGQFWKHVS